MTPLPRFANLALKRCSDNRERYFAQSAATVNRLPAHPPVPRARALVPVASCGTAWGDSDSPDVTDEREPELPNEE